MKDWSTRTVIRTSRGILAVRKPGGPWHLPGGKKKQEHTDWRETAREELEEETGLVVKQFIRIARRHNKRGKTGRYVLIYNEGLIAEHLLYEQIVRSDARREDGEEARVLSFQDIAAMGPEDFDLANKRFLKKHRLLEKRKLRTGTYRHHRRA